MMESAEDAGNQEVESQEQNSGEDEVLESRRFHILRATIEYLIKKTVQSVSSQKIIEIARNANVNKSLSNNEERCINRTYSKFQKALEDIMKTDVDNYMDKSGLLQAHNSISGILSESSSATVSSWRPTGDPRQDMKSHEAENLLKYNISLQKLVEEQEVEIQCLKQHVAHRRLLTHKLTKDLLDLKNECLTNVSHDSTLLLQIEELLKLLSK